MTEKISIKQLIRDVIEIHRGEGWKYITVDDITQRMPHGIRRHTIGNYMSKQMQWEGIVGKGEKMGKAGPGQASKYRILQPGEVDPYVPEKKAKPLPKEPEPTEEPSISFEQLGEAIYTQLITLKRKLRETTDRLRDVEIKLTDERKDHLKTVRKLNASIQEKNSMIDKLHSQAGSTQKTFKLSEVVHTSKRR